MKAMILKKARPVETHPLEPASLPDPRPGQGEILVRVQACGICHTDLHTVEGELPLVKTPIIPGHQVVGVVEQLGPQTRRFKPGESVGIPWLYHTCGECAYCRSENENLCSKAKFTGYHVDGGYAEYLIAPELFSYKIPLEYNYSQAAPLLCAGVIGYRAVRVSGLEPGESLGLLGFGASAHIVIQIARYWNCRVYVFTRSQEHRRLAEQLGAAWTGSADQNPPDLLDRAILFAPAGRLIPNAMQALKKGGTLAIAAIYLDRIPEMDYLTHLYGEKVIRSVTASTRKDAQELLELAPKIPIRTQVQTFPLQEANKALELLKAGKIKGAGVLEVNTTG